MNFLFFITSEIWDINASMYLCQVKPQCLLQGHFAIGWREKMVRCGAFTSIWCCYKRYGCQRAKAHSGWQASHCGHVYYTAPVSRWIIVGIVETNDFSCPNVKYNIRLSIAGFTIIMISSSRAQATRSSVIISEEWELSESGGSDFSPPGTGVCRDD